MPNLQNLGMKTPNWQPWNGYFSGAQSQPGVGRVGIKSSRFESGFLGIVSSRFKSEKVESESSRVYTSRVKIIIFYCMDM